MIFTQYNSHINIGYNQVDDMLAMIELMFTYFYGRHFQLNFTIIILV